MRVEVFLYILVMAAVTYLIRMLPLTLIRRKITNRTLRSFLYYVPYATLSAMTFPAILTATGSAISAALKACSPSPLSPAPLCLCVNSYCHICHCNAASRRIKFLIDLFSKRSRNPRAAPLVELRRARNTFAYTKIRKIG